MCVTGETATRRDEAISLSGRSQIKRRPGYKWHVLLLPRTAIATSLGEEKLYEADAFQSVYLVLNFRAISENEDDGAVS